MSETQDQPEIVARIDLTDLDLTSDRGADQLHRRLSLKARRYCRQSLPAIATPSMRRDCADRIVAENTGKIDRAIDDAKAMRTRS